MSLLRATRIYTSSRATLINCLDHTTGTGERRLPGDVKTQQGHAASANSADGDVVKKQSEETSQNWLVEFDPGVGYEEGTSPAIKRHPKVGFYGEEPSVVAKEGPNRGNDKGAGSDEPLIPSVNGALELDYLQEFPDPNEIMRVRRKSDANAAGGKLTASTVRNYKAQNSASLTDLNLSFLYRTADQNFTEGSFPAKGDSGVGDDAFNDSYLSVGYGEGFCGENTAYERMDSSPNPSFNKFKFQKVVLEEKAEWEDDLEFRCRKYSLDERGKGHRRLGNSSGRRYSRQNSAGITGTVDKDDKSDWDCGGSDAFPMFDRNNRRRSSLEVLFGLHSDEIALPDNSNLLPPLGGVAAINPNVSNWASKLAEQATITSTTDKSQPSPRQPKLASSTALEKPSPNASTARISSGVISKDASEGASGAGAFEEGVGSPGDEHQHRSLSSQRGRQRPSTLSVQVGTRDAETITDVCSGGNIPEVEIISLVEEQIPKYKLRADTITDFAGYENADWGPACKADLPILDLSPEQIRETLNYFRKGAKDVKAGSPGHSGGRESPRGRTRRSLWDLGRNRSRTPPRATNRGETGTPESLSASGLVSQDSGCASGAESINLEDCKEPSRAKSPRRTVPQVRNGKKNGTPSGCESLSVSQLVSQDSGFVSGADSINLDDPAVSLDLSDRPKSKLTPAARSVARNTDRNASSASLDVLSGSSLVSQDSGCVSGAESMVLDDREVSGEATDSRIVKTVPKLERRYSFEYEDGSLFVSGTSPPEKTVTSTPVAKEKPVKPLRKKVVPKPCSPAGVKRRVTPATPAESEGINSIFNPRGKTGSALGSKSQKVVRAGGETEGKLGNAAADQRKPLVKGGTSGKTVKPLRDKLDNSPNARQVNGGAIRKSGNTARGTTVSADGGAAQVGNRSAKVNKSAAELISKETKLAEVESSVLGLSDAFIEPEITVDDASIESDVIQVDDKAVGLTVDLDECAFGLELVEGINEVCCDISSSRGSCSRDPGKDGSPGNDDGGTIDDCDIITARNSEPQMLSNSVNANSSSSRSEHINNEAESLLGPSPGGHKRAPDSTMYVDERISCLGSSPQGGRPAQCYHFSRDKLCNEFGDVSDDIGLDKLNALYGMRALDLAGPGTPLSNQNNNEVYRYAGNFNLQGEFGDVSEDLGAGRFPSLPSDGSVISDASGHSYGVYVSHFEDDEDGQNGVVRRSGRKADVNASVGGFEEDSQGLTHRRVGDPVTQDFPAFPGAVSGMEAEVIEDEYEYDEDYATCVEEGPSLDEELILEVLCANRVSQMTRTYNDIEAVSRLLEEKEKDLELTARIGKELLDQNQGLKARLAALEVEIRTAHEGNTQIRHELQQKTQLLHALTSDEDGSLHDHASPLTSPSDPNLPPLPSGSVLGSLGGKSSARASVELLKRRVSWLEDENKSLRMEASQLARETQRVEEEEAKLVEGVAQQLASVSEESRMLSEELERVRTEGGRHREEVDILLEKLAAAQEEIRRLRQENEELSSMVIITRENQDRLTTELADFKERHGEVMCLLNEAQENLRKMRQKELPSALSGNRYLIPPITTHHGYLNHFGDSIASELESSLNSELSLDSGIHMPDMQGRVPHYRKVFETVRSASRSSNSPSPSPLHRMPSNSSLHHQQLASSSFAQLSTTATLSSSSMQTCRVSARPAASMGDDTGNSGYRNSFSDVPKHLYGGLPTAGFYSLDSAGQSEESDQSGMATDSDECLYPRNANMSGRIRTGVPGSPGAKELQAALVQMSKQEHPTLTKGEKSIGGYEGKSRGSSLDVGPHRWSMSSVSSTVSVCHALPYGCRTPDSIMSTGSSRGSRSSWRMPEKLQIVKPREGSLTLGWWSRLATPSLSAALEERPGVKVRGGVNDSIQQHTLMDLEEDDSMSVASGKSTSKTSAPIHPGKFFQGTASVYTYTNSTVLHPDNVSCVPPSPMPQSPAPMSPTQQQQTPNLLSRRSSISTATPTFSTALGLAKMLHERGISASSSENDLSAQAHFTSATATPCNSPDESPFSSRSPSPDGDEFDPNPIASLISSGAELLRRSLGGGTVPPPSGALQRSSRGRSLKRNSRPPIGSLSRSDRKALAGMKLVEKLERIGLESIMAYSQPLRPFQGLVPLTTTLQVGTMYARPAVKSPMAQLTSLKSTLRSRSTESHDDEMDGPSPAKQRPKPCRRQDLGTVPTVKKAAVDPLQAGPGGARGTISAIFFGRKGGLM